MPLDTPGYTGPIIDAHHPLWDLSAGRYPWLTGDAGIAARYVAAAPSASPDPAEQRDLFHDTAAAAYGFAA